MTAAFTTIPDSQIEQDKPVTEVLLSAFRDNPIAIAQGDASAPRVKPVILHVVDEKPSGTTGGFNASSGIFGTRTLNTVKTNTITGASVGSNQITLPAGDYEIDAHAPGYNCSSHMLALYNVTDAAYVHYGTSEWTLSGAQIQTRSFVRGRFTIASTKVFELRHYTFFNATSSLGANVSISGVVERYTDCRIVKIG